MTRSFFEESPLGSALLLSSVEELKRKHHECLQAANSKLPATLELLNDEEAAQLRLFYHQKIRDICTAFKFSPTVTESAHYYLHRYFLKYSLLDHDPKHIMLTCLFLATKAENMHLTMEDFGSKIPNTQVDLIVDLEVTVLEAIDFNMAVFHPLTCLTGFLLDAHVGELVAGVEDWHMLARHAKDALARLMMIEEVVLMSAPSFIALAALQTAAASLKISLERYWSERLVKLPNLEATYKQCEEICAKLAALKIWTPAELKPVDRKLQLARAAL